MALSVSARAEPVGRPSAAPLRLATGQYITPTAPRGAVQQFLNPGLPAYPSFVAGGLKESPPYLHDGRSLTLEDVIEFFNLVLQTKLTQQEKDDMLAFLLTL